MQQNLRKQMTLSPPAGYYSLGFGLPRSLAIQREDQILKALNITEPMFKVQWHLFDPIQPCHEVKASGIGLSG